jgi:hypothetical protein
VYRNALPEEAADVRMTALMMCGSTGIPGKKKISPTKRILKKEKKDSTTHLLLEFQ